MYKLYKVKNPEGHPNEDGHHWRGYVYGMTNVMSGETAASVRSRIFSRVLREIAGMLSVFVQATSIIIALYLAVCLFFYLFIGALASIGYLLGLS